MKLLKDISSLDRFQIRENLEKFSYSVSENETTDILRPYLKKVVLEEFLKSDIVEKKFFQDCLMDTNSVLALNDSGYLCTLVGCRF